MSKNRFNLTKYLPFLEWISELKDKSILKRDILAGITVSFILIPQSMAYAGLAGLPIEVGLYTAFIPVILAGLFGSSKQMSTGPVTIVSLMTATALAPIATAGTEGYIAYASLLAFFIGLFYLLLGTLRMGIIVDFLSHPVIIGFTNAVALITIISQAGKIFGISIDKGGSFFEAIFNLIQGALSNTHIATLIVGLSSIFFLIIVGKISRKIPRVLFLLILSIFISFYFGFESNYGLSVVKDIPSSLPEFSIPFLSHYVTGGFLSFSDITNLFIFACIIALIGFTESISVAKYISTKTKQKVNPNRELLGQGLANLSSGLFGGYGVAGSFSKTAVNLRAGAVTGLASVVTGLMVGATLLFLTPLLYHLPMVVLAAIIMVAVSDLIKIKPLIKAWKVDKHDGIVGLITFLLTLSLTPNIELGILAGILLSMGLFIYRSMRPRLIEVAKYKDGLYRDIELFGLKTSKSVSIFRFDGVLYFANAGYFEDKILDLIKEKKKLKYVIIDLEWMADIDSSGIETLTNLIDRLNSYGIKVLLTGPRIKVILKFKHSEFLENFSKRHMFAHVEKGLEYIYDKEDGKIDTGPLYEYHPNKNGVTELGRYIIKKYIKKD